MRLYKLNCLGLLLMTKSPNNRHLQVQRNGVEG
jgi:hypothetical protein